MKKAIILVPLLFIALAGKAQQPAKKEIVTDVVCGMEVNTAESYDYKYKSKKYYFDSYNCRKAFINDPENFLQKKCVIDKVAIDPVCGVKVDLTESYDHKFEGRVYHFHSLECKEAFKINPKKFRENFCVAKDSEPIK